MREPFWIEFGCASDEFCSSLGWSEFPITQTEVQITASNDGDFFHAHCDDAQDGLRLVA